MFDFNDLCGKPVSAADYLALGSRFHTLALKGLPAFGAATKAEAYRFVTLIDVLYEHKYVDRHFSSHGFGCAMGGEGGECKCIAGPEGLFWFASL